MTKSRTFAVILTAGEQLATHFLWKRQAAGEPPELVHRWMHLPWPASTRDVLVRLLTEAGLTTRHYDPAERQWMDTALHLGGTTRAPGQRDGQWHRPDLESFEREYLSVV